MGERRVNERLHSADHVHHPFGLHPGGLLTHQRLALGLAPEAIGHVSQEACREHLTADGHSRRAHLGREATSVAALELELQNAGGVGFRRVEQIAAKLIVGLTQLRRDDQSPQRLPDCFGGRPAEHALGRGVPGANAAVTVDGDKRVGGAVQHDPRPRLLLGEQQLALP